MNVQVHKLPNDLRLGILGNKEILAKYHKAELRHSLVPSVPSKNENLSITQKKKIEKNELLLFL